MFLSKKLVTNIPVVVYERKGSTSSQIQEEFVLSPGFYEIVCIGGGGGGALARGQSSTSTNRHWACGGVGGTVVVRVFVHRITTTTISIAKSAQGNTGSFTGSGVTVSGTNGNSSSIVGIDNLTLTAGGGTGAIISSTSAVGANRTAGVIGSNTVSGSAIKDIRNNNNIRITSGDGVLVASGNAGQTSMNVVYANNINWPADTTRGRGGSVGYPNGSGYNIPGNPGYVRITKL